MTKKKIYFSTHGTGKIHIFFFHGWGIDSIIWKKIIILLKPYFTIHTVDFPGFGKNIYCPIMDFNQLSKLLLKKIKKKVIWLGWSMGGLMAHYLGFRYPHYTLSVIHITSSPCFIQKFSWPGIQIEILNIIKTNILTNYQEFFKQFILLHAQNTKEKNKYQFTNTALISKKYPNPKKKSIEIGYQWLTQIDQRESTLSNKIPILRIYGELDNLVPIQTCRKINFLWNNSSYYIIPHSRHAPFLSHPHVFCKILKTFIHEKIES